MAIPAKTAFDFGDLGTLTVGVEDDAGTLRVIVRYNGQKVRDITPSGGHVEDRTAGSLPTDYEVS